MRLLTSIVIASLVIIVTIGTLWVAVEPTPDQNEFSVLHCSRTNFGACRFQHGCTSGSAGPIKSRPQSIVLAGVFFDEFIIDRMDNKIYARCVWERQNCSQVIGFHSRQRKSELFGKGIPFNTMTLNRPSQGTKPEYLVINHHAEKGIQYILTIFLKDISFIEHGMCRSETLFGITKKEAINEWMRSGMFKVSNEISNP